MLVVLGGPGDCSSLTASGGVTWNTGTDTITLVPTSGLYI